MSKSPCSECAFSKTGAALEPYNAIRAEVCALGPLPFGCHHGLNWNGSKMWTPDEQRANLRKSGMCEGWKARVRLLNSKGFFGKYTPIRRAIAKQFLELLEVWLAETDEKEKSSQHRAMKRMLRFLASRDIEHKKIPLLY